MENIIKNVTLDEIISVRSKKFLIITVLYIKRYTNVNPINSEKINFTQRTSVVYQPRMKE